MMGYYQGTAFEIPMKAFIESKPRRAQVVEEVDGAKWNGVNPIVVDTEDLDQLVV